MSARVVSINPAQPREDRLGRALEALRAGGIVAIPTETFYGLAADALSAAAVAGLNALKQRPAGAPVLLLLADAGQAGQVAASFPDGFASLSERFWPGPLTLVVPASEALPDEVTAGGRTVAVRVPGLALPRRLAAGLGRPITGVSANPHGRPPCRTAAEVARALPEGLNLILDGGPTPGGLASTVLDLCQSPPRVVREGAVPATSLEAFLPGLRRSI